MILNFALVLEYLAVEFVDERIDGRIHILRLAFHMQVFATQVQINFGTLSFLFFSQGVD